MWESWTTSISNITARTHARDKQKKMITNAKNAWSLESSCLYEIAVKIKFISPSTCWKTKAFILHQNSLLNLNWGFTWINIKIKASKITTVASFSLPIKSKNMSELKPNFIFDSFIHKFYRMKKVTVTQKYMLMSYFSMKMAWMNHWKWGCCIINCFTTKSINQLPTSRKCKQAFRSHLRYVLMLMLIFYLIS